MKTKISYERMFEFVAISQQWLVKDQDNADTKLGYALNKMMSRLKKSQKRYHARVDEIQIDTCVVSDGEAMNDQGKRTPKGCILKDANGQFEYTKEGALERNRKIQELFESQFEVEAYFATELPDKLTYAEREAFDGLVMVNTPECEEPLTEKTAEQPSVS